MTTELRSCRALVFDLMGTCVDWHSSLLSLLPITRSQPSQPTAHDALLTAWRAVFFAEIQSRHVAKLPPEDIDVTHRRLLETLLHERGLGETDGWTEEKKVELVQGWHFQQGWPDALEGLSRLREKFFMCVFSGLPPRYHR
jgi:FMN phosphatase YigB (HAD superfamily)